MENIFAKGGKTKVKYDYIPQNAIDELSYTIDKVTKGISGDKLLSGVYVKSDVKSKTKSGSNLTAKILGMTDDEDKKEVILEKDVKEFQKYISDKLITAFYLGLPEAYDFKGDYSYGGGVIAMRVDVAKRKTKEAIKNAKNKKFEMGLKYPQYDFEKLLGKPIIKDVFGKLITFNDGSTEKYKYRLWIWKDCVIGQTLGSESSRRGGYTDYTYGEEPTLIGGYKSVQTSKASKLESIINFMAKDKDGFVKDNNVLFNGLGGANFETLDSNKIKYAKGGEVEFKTFANSLPSTEDAEGIKVYNTYTETFGFINDDLSSRIPSKVFVSKNKNSESGKYADVDDLVVVQDKMAKGGGVEDGGKQNITHTQLRNMLKDLGYKVSFKRNSLGVFAIVKDLEGKELPTIFMGEQHRGKWLPVIEIKNKYSILKDNEKVFFAKGGITEKDKESLRNSGFSETEIEEADRRANRGSMYAETPVSPFFNTYAKGGKVVDFKFFGGDTYKGELIEINGVYYLLQNDIKVKNNLLGKEGRKGYEYASHIGDDLRYAYKSGFTIQGYAKGGETEVRYTEDELKYALGVDDDYENWVELAFQREYKYDESKDEWYLPNDYAKGGETEVRYTEDELKYALGVDDDYENWVELAFQREYKYDESKDEWYLPNDYAKGGEIQGGAFDLSLREKSAMYKYLDKGDFTEEKFMKMFGKNEPQTADIIYFWAESRGLNTPQSRRLHKASMKQMGYAKGGSVGKNSQIFVLQDDDFGNQQFRGVDELNEYIEEFNIGYGESYKNYEEFNKGEKEQGRKIIRTYAKGGKTKRSKHSLMQDRRRVSSEPWEVAYQKTKSKMEKGGKVDTTIAKTIIQQMGGMRRLSMFTGAKNFVALSNGVSFRIGNKSVNFVKITLNGKDLYDLTFGLMRNGKLVNKKEYNDIYNDQLKSIFEKHTGMYLSFEAGGTLPTPFGQAGLVGETGAMNEMELFAMGGGLPQGVHQYYANTYNPAYPTPHGYAKGGEVSDKRQRVAEFKVEMDLDNGFYDEELDREYGSVTYKEALEWELKNRIKTDEDADYYLDEDGDLVMEKGGKIQMSEVYNVNGKDYLFSTPIQNDKGTYTGWDAYEVVYDTFDGEKHLNYTKTKRGKSKYFPNGVKRTEAEDYYAKGGKLDVTKEFFTVVALDKNYNPIPYNSVYTLKSQSDAINQAKKWYSKGLEPKPNSNKRRKVGLVEIERTRLYGERFEDRNLINRYPKEKTDIIFRVSDEYPLGERVVESPNVTNNSYAKGGYLEGKTYYIVDYYSSKSDIPNGIALKNKSFDTKEDANTFLKSIENKGGRGFVTDFRKPTQDEISKLDRDRDENYMMAKGGLTDSKYIPSYEVFEVVTKDGKVYENDYSAMEFLSGAYVSDKVVTQADEKDGSQMTLFDKGGKIPKGAIYIKRRDIDFITVGEDEDDKEKVDGKNLFNGFWIDPKKQKTLIAEAKKDGRLGKSKAKSKAKYKGGVDKENYKYFKGYRANTTQYLLLDDSNGYLVTKYRNSDVNDSYDVYDEDYNFRGSADSISKGESGKQKIKLVKSDFKNAKSFKDLVVKKRIDFNSAITMAKGGEVIDTFTSIQGSKVMPNNPFTIEKENEFYVIKNSKGEVLAKDTTKDGIMNDKGMFLNLYAKGGEVEFKTFANSLPSTEDAEGIKVYNTYTETFGFINDDLSSRIPSKVFVSKNKNSESGKYADVDDLVVVQDKMAKGGKVKTYKMTDDSYENIFLSRGFKSKRGSKGLKFFEHKPSGTFITYDPRGTQTRVIIESSTDPETSKTLYEGDTMSEVKKALDNANVPKIKEGVDGDYKDYAKGGKTQGGKRKYASVKTMDKGNRSKRKTPMSLAKEIRKEGEKWQDAVKRASAIIKKEAK